MQNDKLSSTGRALLDRRQFLAHTVSGLGGIALAQMLAEQGLLRDGVSEAEATDILTVITSFQAFDELFSGSGLPADVVADRLIAMAERSICRPDV